MPAAGSGYSCAIREAGELALHPAVVVPGALASDWLLAARIIARRLPNDSAEFGFRLPGGNRILPTQRFLPNDAPIDRWLNSSAIELDGDELGRISARKLANGRIEFAFLTPTGERILPWWRSLAPQSPANVWLWGSEIGIKR